VEKVLNPPQKPITISERRNEFVSILSDKEKIANPIMTQAKTLAISVPIGKLGEENWETP